MFVFSVLGTNMMWITVAPETHDIAVVSVTPYPTKVGLGLGEIVNVTVIIENQGTESENFAVTVYYDGIIIETQNVVNQVPNTNKTLAFTWNTTGIAVGTYSINATASIVSGETDAMDNMFISPSKVYVVSPYIAVLPRRTVNTTLTPSTNYTVSLYTNYNGSDIWAYQFELTYNPLVLQGTEVVNGDLITEGDVDFIAGDFNNTAGKLELTAAYTIPTASQTEPGILANVTFTIVGTGDSNIELGRKTSLKRPEYQNNIIDYITDLDPDPTSGKFLHGYFRNTEEAVIHDMAVISIEPSPNNVIYGEVVTIDVAVKNKGTSTERVSVEVFWDYDPKIGPLHFIETQTTTIESGANTTLSFTWDTTYVPAAIYPITAVATSLGGFMDTNPHDNMLKVDDAVKVKEAVPPAANAGPDLTVDEDTLIILDGSASSDNIGITTYIWTITEVTTKTLTGEKPTYTFNTPGVYTVALNVTDSSGNWATDTVIITVLDVTKPVANAGQNQTVNVGDPATFNASESTDNVDIINYNWDFGDGTTGTDMIEYHTYTELGTYNVRLKVWDGAGNSDTDLITVTVKVVVPLSWWILGIIAVIGITSVAILFWKLKVSKTE